MKQQKERNRTEKYLGETEGLSDGVIRNLRESVLRH